MFSNLGEMIPRELPGSVPWLTEIAPDGAERTLDFLRSPSSTSEPAR